MNKIFRFYFFAAILTVAMMSFSCSGNAQGQPKTQKEVEAKLKNFSLSFVTESDSQDPFYFKQVYNDKGSFYESKCERMQSFDNDFNEIFIEYNKIEFVDFNAKKAYQLDVITKTGEVFEFDAAGAAKFKGFDRLIAQYLFMHEGRQDLKKTGSEKIIGRNATVYTIKYFDEEHQKFWIDNEYGFTLKFEQFNPVMIMYVTGFTAGGATVEGLVDINEYDFDSEPAEASEEQEPEIIEGVLSLAAMKKAVTDAGFNEACFRVGGGYANKAKQSVLKIEPIDGFDVFRQIDGSNWNVINVLEFETEALAAQFVEHITSDDAGVSLIAHRSGVFTVDISKNRAADLEAKLMGALKKAGWE
jgi:hypothetical protein